MTWTDPNGLPELTAADWFTDAAAGATLRPSTDPAPVPDLLDLDVDDLLDGIDDEPAGA